jgi:predicted RNA binding protein YcfA (HicA-like mRNA interferase family)
MPRLPRVTAREVQRAVEHDGWVWVGGSGSHRQFTHPTKRGRVTIAFHGNATIKADTLKRIVQQAGLTVQDFIDLL